MKPLMLLLLFISIKSYACKEFSTYVDIDNGKSRIDVRTTGFLILRSNTEITWKPNPSVKIKLQEHEGLGGLFLYRVVEKKRPLKTQLNIRAEGQNILIDVNLLKMSSFMRGKTDKKSKTISSECKSRESLIYH